jgi:gas vesicle protein
MDAVTFHGREYQKATALALKYRYTPDYLGQLARAKKVDARLVGRAWYINEESLLEHRDGKYKTSTESEITDIKPINNYLSRVAVEPYLKNKTARLVLGTNGAVASNVVTYEEDQHSLLPRMKKDIQPTRVRVNLADSEKIRITTDNKKPTNFKAEPLPDVALSGTLVIEDITDEPFDAYTEPEIAPEVSLELEPEVIPKKTLLVRAKRPATTPLARKIPAPGLDKTSSAHPAPTKAVPTSFTPAGIPMGRLQKPAAPPTSLLVPTLVVTTAFVIAFGLLATNLEITTTRSGSDYNWNLALANILLLLP